MNIYINGKARGILITENDVIIGNTVVGDLNGSNTFYPAGVSAAKIDDNITLIPPSAIHLQNIFDFNGSSSDTPYRFLEIRTTGSITVSGILDASGQGYIGGNAGANGLNFSINGIGGYLNNSINADPLNEKTTIEAKQNGYIQEKHRNVVFPGSGGSGGAKKHNDTAVSTSGSSCGGSAGGGCGGGFVRLIANKGITITDTGKIKTNGLLNGGDGGAGTFNPGDITCNIQRMVGNNCVGTQRVDTPSNASWTGGGGWLGGTHGLGGRGAGHSSGGGSSACCESVSVGLRAWSSCSDQKHLKPPVDKNYYPSNKCQSGNGGFGGAGGGVLLRSYGPIIFQKESLDLRGYNGVKHGGTLKIFHNGIIPPWVLDSTDSDKAKASVDIKKIAGGFYNELLYAGYCIDSSTMKVQSLTSVANMYTAGNEKFDIDFDEGNAYIPNGIEVKHGGYELYRFIDTDGVVYNGVETPPSKTDTGWVKIANIPYITDSLLGPQNIDNPTNNQVAFDSIGRQWIYNVGDTTTVPAWYLNKEYSKAINKFFISKYTDNGILDYLIVSKNKPYNTAVSIIQDILYSKKALWYYVKPIFTVSNITLTPECGTTGYKHPEVTPPQMSLFLNAYKSDPYEYSTPHITGRILNSDLRRPDKYYDAKKYSSENIARGFDDLYVHLNTPTNWGSFEFSSWKVDWDVVHTNQETFTSMSIDINTPRQDPNTINRLKKYVDPTMVGRNVLRPTQYDSTGKKAISVSGIFNENCYNKTENTILVKTGSATIFEREPTPVFNLSAVDTPDMTSRTITLPVGDNKINKYFTKLIDNNLFYFGRVVSGYANGVAINFFDESVARTYPISSWNFNSDLTKTTVPTLCTLSIGTQADTQMTRPSDGNPIVIPTTIYNNAGVYYPTLTVQASTTNTSHDLSAINRVLIYPIAPTALFTSEASSNEVSISAFVPINFSALDLSLENSYYPITVWNWSIYDNYDRTKVGYVSTFYTKNQTLEHKWKWHTDNYEISNITVDNTLNNLCLSVATSAYGRWGKTDYDGVTSLFLDGDVPVFSQDVECKHLYLYERPPVSDLSAVSGVTYKLNFSDDDPDFQENPVFTSDHYVSGFCPYVNITFQEKCTAKSYPISGYLWNFNDYFNEDTNIYRYDLPLSATSTGWTVFPEDHGLDGSENYPEWTTAAKDHKTEHIFTLPGLYTVTLFAKASSTGTTRSSVLSVYLEENPPTCGFVASLDKINWTHDSQVLSGDAPLTVYFMPSGVTAGSFPIGRLVWNFGDSTEPLIVDRYMNNYLNQPMGSDPRGYNGGYVEHVFERQHYLDTLSFNVSCTVVAEYSNTEKTCSGITVGPVKLPSFSTDSDEVHLIKNRSLELNNNNLYILQRESDKSVYNITLSSN